MSEEKQLVISRIERGETEDGKVAIELYEDNPKLRFPSLRLFEPSKLFSVGIDPNEFQPGEERFVQFRAYYVESDRKNQAGNAYKDVTRLEALEAGQRSRTEQKLDAIADLLKSIDRRLASIDQLTEVAVSAIVRLAGAKQEPLGPGGVPVGPDDWPGDDEPEPELAEDPALSGISDRQGEEALGPAPQPAAESEEHDGPILSEDMARRRFGKLAGSGMRDGTIDRSIPGKLTNEVSAGALSWRDALQQLQATIAEQV